MKKLVSVVVAMAALAGCAINPATGRRQLVLISETDERKMGLQYDKSVVSEMGLYPDDSLQRYVQQTGNRLAARSERPDLDWTFRVVDDPAVNAFALPGGYVYVTRGILAHFNSEAELAAVLGHEIGHVTARHGVNQMSKAQLAQIGMGLGTIFAPEEAQRFGGLAQAGLSVMFLKFSRDDERQADDLGLRYAIRGGYDPRPMTDVFDMLESVSRLSGSGRLPGWLSTHPHPENRRETIAGAIAATGTNFTGRTIERESYLKRIDGIVFGENPRHGYFKGTLFLHPDMEFGMRFPEGWKTSNQRQAVSAMSEGKDAIVALSLSSGSSAAASLADFLSQEGVSRVAAWDRPLPGLPTRAARFSVSSQEGTMQGIAAFVEHEGKVFRLLGYAPEAQWPAYEPVVAGAMASFDRLTDSRVLNVKPRRLKIVEASGGATLQALASRYAAAVPLKTLAVINNLPPDARLQAGQAYKVVTGEPLP